MNQRFKRLPRLGACVVFLTGLGVLQARQPDHQSPATDAKNQKSSAQDRPSETSNPPKLRPAARTGAAKPGALASAVIREPSQGRPIFITPGDTFYFVMSLPPDFTGDVGFALQHAMEPSIRIPLKPTTPPSYVNNEYCSLVLHVGPNVTPGLYDLSVRTASNTYYSRRSIKVVDRFRTKFRFVHLSNMNVGDLTAPEFDDMIPSEVNLLAPEFIVATGDYTEWARARNDASSWQRVLSYFEKFNAPIFMLCGLHDHEASFTRFVASKPIGTIDYGNYHGLLLLDHPGNPIDQDYSQIQWVDADLKRNRHRRMNFIVANSDELGLLDVWRERGNILGFIKKHRIAMFIVGGSTDWDYKEFADKLQGLDGLHLIRTHQSSTCMRDRATGFSHYRVIEVDGDKLSYVYAEEDVSQKLLHSVPTGRLRTYFDAPNDGSVSRVGVTIQNALNQSFDDARIWLRVAKNSRGDKPRIAPGRLIRVLDLGDYWSCEISCDLPDKSAVRLVASVKPADIPETTPVAINLDGPRDWVFSLNTTDFGLSYYESPQRVYLKLTNTAETDLECWPVVRVNGSQLHADRSVVSRLPLALKPGETRSVPLILNLRRLSPGPHKLQVYFLEDPLSRLTVFDINLSGRQAVTIRDGHDQ